MNMPTEGRPDSGILTDDALWYQDAVIYQLHVKAFCDSNDDGIGDFRGLTGKLEYIRELGVNTIWLLPFYPSPLKDDGYDVADYHNIHPQYGTRADFRNFMRAAHDAGLKVVTELVVNHTSDQHAWFQAARRAPRGSTKRNFYVWSDDPQKYSGTRIIFTDTENSNWAWDDVAKQYYWHRFFSHQPDLNFANPLVLKAIFRIMRFWLDMGVDGFRLDAIPYLCERHGTNNENLPETHAVIKQIRASLDAHYRNRVLLAEANQWPEDVREYFGAADECHMAYHFPLMPRIYMAIAQEDRYPVVEIMQQTPDIPASCQWAIFLRNHDELTLEMVTSRERDYMYRMYAAEPRARINLGIRRRLAPLMENDRDRIKLMNSLLLSMPGSPIIYYGDEIGMGDNIYLGDRNGVRTPMQWSPDRNAGFSRADPQRIYLPPIMDPIYGYQAINVEAQTRDPSSLLNWMRKILAVRKTSRVFGRGRLTFLRPGNRKVLAYLREFEDDAVLCVANLSRSAQPVELELARYKGRVPVEMLGRTPFPPIGELPYLLTLPAYGFYWFRLTADAPVPSWHSERFAPEDVPMLVLFDGWASFFSDRVVPWRIAMAEKLRADFETAVLPRYLHAQRWYAAKGEPLDRAPLQDTARWEHGDASWLVTLVEAKEARYFMPLTLGWEDETDDERLRLLQPATIARVRQQAAVGVLADAFADERFIRAVLTAIAANEAVPTDGGGQLRFVATRAFGELAGPDVHRLAVNRPQAQSSNTVVTLGDRLLFKGYRRLRRGVNPEVELGRHLTETVRFDHAVPLAGTVEYVAADGAVMTLALLQAYVRNQGDGWSYTLAYLTRSLDEADAPGAEVADDRYGAYTALMETLGTRTAELHAALARETGDAAFDPEPASAEDFRTWRERVMREAGATLDELARRASEFPAAVRAQAEAVAHHRERLMTRITALALPQQRMLKTRHHGDYHLGQVLLARNDFIIIDFEGEPGRPLAERKQKASPLRDVAGMLRSFSYARAAAVQRLSATAAERERHETLAATWERQAREAFLRAYVAHAQRVGLLASLADVADLLQLFELEKALYEVRYEMNNRPDWLPVPLAGVARLLAPGPDPAG